MRTHSSKKSVAIVRAISRRSRRGIVQLGGMTFPCALGRSGCSHRKFEGDGATPIGIWPVLHVLFRPDCGPRPSIGRRARPISPQSGWCDAVGNRNYNRPVPHPYPASSEHLWRPDRLYDLIVVLGYNDRPRAQGRGSAIFMHMARTGYAPTEGCIALRRPHLLRLLHPSCGLRAVRIGT